MELRFPSALVCAEDKHNICLKGQTGVWYETQFFEARRRACMTSILQLAASHLLSEHRNSSGAEAWASNPWLALLGLSTPC